jgi:lipoprotein-anchoring transpeptidase ErfK/SrfK
MGRHRLEPTRVRPRYSRVAAAALSLTVTLVALLGAVGVLPVDSARRGADPAGDAAQAAPPAAGQPGTTDTSASTSRTGRSTVARDDAAAAAAVADVQTATALPAASGQGRRVVFSKSAQRVWLVDRDGEVEATYLVSGSLTENLAPGSYDVYSRSRWAVGIEDSGVMQYFVRFAHGRNAAIGFHSIPTKNGVPLQTVAQLGTPQSHGCIRQKLSDAVRMWDFAPVGTDVVVVA